MPEQKRTEGNNLATSTRQNFHQCIMSYNSTNSSQIACDTRAPQTKSKEISLWRRRKCTRVSLESRRIEPGGPPKIERASSPRTLLLLLLWFYFGAQPTAAGGRCVCGGVLCSSSDFIRLRRDYCYCCCCVLFFNFLSNREKRRGLNLKLTTGTPYMLPRSTLRKVTGPPTVRSSMVWQWRPSALLIRSGRPIPGEYFNISKCNRFVCREMHAVARESISRGAKTRGMDLLSQRNATRGTAVSSPASAACGRHSREGRVTFRRGRVGSVRACVVF